MINVKSDDKCFPSTLLIYKSNISNAHGEGILLCTNFDFLKSKHIFKSFATSAVEAEKSLLVSPATCAILSRRAVELAVKWVYSFKNRN